MTVHENKNKWACVNTNDEIKYNVTVVLEVRENMKVWENMKLLASHRVLTVVEKVPYHHVIIMWANNFLQFEIVLLNPENLTESKIKIDCKRFYSTFLSSTKHQNHLYINILKNTTYVALVTKKFVAQCNTRTLHVISQKWAMCYRKIGLADVDTSMNIEGHVCTNLFNTW